MRAIWIVPIIASILILGIIAYSPISFANDDDDNGSPGGSVTLTVIDRESETISIPRGTFGLVSVFCQAGEIATGGGFEVPTGAGFPFIDINVPEFSNGLDGWEVGVFNNEPCECVDCTPPIDACGATITVRAIVMCATLDGGVGGNGDDDNDDDD